MELRVNSDDPLDYFFNCTQNVKCEVIDGQIIMKDAPMDDHQSVISELHGQLWSYLRGKECVVRLEPALLFRENERRPNAFRPDIAVVCDKSKMKKFGILGAPDLIIEVLSPSTKGHDKLLKFNRYQREGVQEYWIVDPEDRMVSVYILRNGSYMAYQYGNEDKIKVSVLEDCHIDLSGVFPPTAHDDSDMRYDLS